MKTLKTLLSVMLALILCAACAVAETGSEFPFDLVTYQDSVVTFTHVPERVIAANACTGDELMAMGLEDVIIGKAYTNSPINPEYQEAYDKIPVVADTYMSLETILSWEPDFVYGRSSHFSEKNGTQHDTLSSYGIMSLSDVESYKLGADIEDVYEDFGNLVRIFQKQERAEEIINDMKTRVAAVEEAVAGKDIAKVFVFDMQTEDGPYTCGNNFTSQLIKHAGGENIFSDLDTTWATVSWEDVIDRNPDVIIINDYGDTSLEEKIAQLKENPALATITAIQNDNIISVHLVEVFASSQAATTIEKMAHACHPDCFED